MLRPEIRSFFSRRHKITKQQIPNEFEFDLMKKWVNLTGRNLEYTDSGVNMVFTTNYEKKFKNNFG